MSWLLMVLGGCPPIDDTSTTDPWTTGESGLDTGTDTGTDTATDTATDTGAPPAQPDTPYLMSFHTCDTDDGPCGDPSIHEVHLAGSHDGFSWTVVDWVEPFNGSVPDVFVRDGVLYLYDVVTLRTYDLATRELIARNNLEILGDEPIFQADPSLILDDEGRLVVFFLEGLEGQDPASCPDEQPPCTKRILSATEVVGAGGHQFTLDDGARVEILVEDNTASRVSDPDILADPDGFKMLISRGQNVQVYESTELRGAFAPASDKELNAGSGGVPAAIWVPEDQQYWLYLTSDRGGELSEITFAAVDSLTEKLDDSALVAIELGPEALQGVVQVASPGVWATE